MAKRGGETDRLERRATAESGVAKVCQSVGESDVGKGSTFHEGVVANEVQGRGKAKR